MITLLIIYFTIAAVSYMAMTKETDRKAVGVTIRKALNALCWPAVAITLYMKHIRENKPND